MNKPEMVDQEKPLNRTGYAHIAFSVGSRERVDALTEELKAAGYEVVSGPRTTGDGYYESCVVAIEGDPAMYEQALKHLIEETKAGRMFGEWNDYGRLLED